MSDPASVAATFPIPGPARITVDDRRIYRISGPGTDKFLQGQFSQQMADVTEHLSPLAAACTPKGRAYCLTRMVRDGNDILVALPRSLAEDTIKHLQKFLMLFRGTSMEAETGATIIGLLGDTAADALLASAPKELPAPADTRPIPGGHLVRTMDTAEGLARFEFWQTADMPAETRQALDEVPAETLATWRASEIAAGIPALTPETREQYVPQMLNWHHLGGVHFKKGCYTGQEVIARMHFLGQLKKSLYRLSCPSGDQGLVIGTSLVSDGRSVGEVVSSERLSDGTSQCLAVIRHDAAAKPLTLQDAPDCRLTHLSLPYRVPEREDGKETPETGGLQ